MVVVRLARHGAKKRPFYQINVAEKTAPRDGRFIERLGFYNPVHQGKAERVRVDLQRYDHWLEVGARPSERVVKLVKEFRKMDAIRVAAQLESGEDLVQAQVDSATDSETEVAEELADQPAAELVEGGEVEDVSDESQDDSGSPDDADESEPSS